jgi:outer membrane receptor protein involved in Fe transport
MPLKLSLISKIKARTSLSSAVVLGVMSATASASFLITTPAFAQDYTSGALSGIVTDESGATVSGATVTISSESLGITRTVTTSSQGGFRVTALPAGLYNVDAKAPNGDSYRAEGVQVQSSTATDISVIVTAGDTIVVTGSAIRQVFAGNTTGVNVDLADLTKNVAVSRDLSSIIMLAPGTTKGDSEFGNEVSISGSSVAENAYYINGLNITNFDNYLGSASVPFEFYKSIEVKSGGYAAEYGRATGGIINAVTKSGTNDFTAAAHVNWQPNFLRSKAKDTQRCQYEDDGVTIECFNNTDRRADTQSSYSAILEAGGALITDRLFVYGLVEFRNTESVTHDPSSGIAYFRKNNDPYWGAKVDAYPIDSQHFEFTIFDTRNTTTRVSRGYDYGSNGQISGYGAGSTVDFNYGGVNWVGKYTGTMTDWLTLSAAYGVSKDRFDNQPDNADDVYIQNSSGSVINGVNNDGIISGQTSSSIDQPYRTKREFFRADADLFFSALGDHHIRMGYDVENNTLDHVTVRTGAGQLCSTDFWAACDRGGAAIIYRADSIVEFNYYNSGGSFKSKNQAFYIQDEWQVTPRLTLNLGLRRDDFSVKKPDGSNLVNLKENYAPRLAAYYKMWDDESGSLKASYNEYYLPVASNTAYRQASSEFFFRERYAYTGIDSNGLPILGTPYTSGAYNNICPFELAVGSTGVNCAVTGDGSIPDTSAAIAHNLKATKESEIIVGYEHKVGDWRFGISYTRRRMERSAEDMAIDAAVLAYCDDNDIAGCSDTWTGFHQYVVTNPGSDLEINLWGLDGQKVTLSAEALGYPKATRKYDAIDFTFNRPFRDGWSLAGSYTWSKSRGNSEGFVQSDFGQSDSGITQDFDQPGFIPGAYGFLPNDRRHRFKLWGSAALSDWFTVGVNAFVESPRNLSCIGFNPLDAFANVYNQASHYCGGILSPRGTAQKSNWTSQFDISLRARKELAGGQTVTLRADVFNLLNTRAITKREEIGDLEALYADADAPLPNGYIRDPSYGLATSYQAPRYVRLGFDINF